MDYILLALCVYLGIKGCIKGLVSMLFAMFGVVVTVIAAWMLTKFAMPYVSSVAGNMFTGLIEDRLNSLVPGEFSNMTDLLQAVGNSKLSMFGALLFRLCGDITFEGSLTIGQIFAPSISNLLIKIIVFIAIFIILYLLTKILRFFINKIIKKCGLSVGNRMLGAALGILKGLILFGILYFVLVSLANLFLLEGLLKFIEDGAFSKFIYNNFIIKIFQLFY